MRIRFIPSAASAAILTLITAATATVARADGADRWLPETTAVYVSVDDVTATSERFGAHPLKSLWDDPKMQKFLEGPLGKLKEVLEKAAAESGGANPADLLKMLRGQVAFAVTGIRDVEGGGRRIGIVLFADVGSPAAGGNEPQLLEWIHKAESSLKTSRRVEDEFRGVKIVTYEPKEPKPAKKDEIDAGPPCWFLAEGIWAVSDDPEVLREVLSRKAGGEEPSLSGNASYRRVREAVGSGEGFVFVNAARIWDVAQRLTAKESSAPKVFKVLDALGLKSLQAFGFRLALTPQGVETRGFVLASPPHRGLLKLLDAENAAITMPRFVPADVQSAGVMTLDLQAVWKEVRKVMEQIEPTSTASIDKAFAEMKEKPGVDVEAEVIGSLGKTVTFYTPASAPKAKAPAPKTPAVPGGDDEGEGEGEEAMEGQVLPGMSRVVFAIELSNPATFSSAFAKLMSGVGPSIGLESKDYMGTALWLPQEGSHMPLGIGVVGNQLVVATSAEDLKHVVRVQGQAEAGSLVTSPDFKRGTEGLPASRVALSYSDARRAMDDMSKSFGMLGSLPFDMDWLNLHLFPGDLVKSYMDVGGGVLVRESDGFSFFSRSFIHKP